MICQKCGTDIPEDKIYCEKCGNAIQMVPDYNPNEDFTVGTEEKEQQSVPEEAFTASDSWWYRRRYWLAGIGLLILGILAYQISFHYVFHPEETATEPEEVELPAKPEFGIQPGIYSYSPQLTISHREKTMVRSIIQQTEQRRMNRVLCTKLRSSWGKERRSSELSLSGMTEYKARRCPGLIG